MKTTKRIILISLSLLLTANIVFADAGVPMIVLIMPGFLVSIAPIIIIESLYLKRKLMLPQARAWSTAATSNLVSTIAGVPLTWLILVLVEMFTGGSRAYGIDTVIGKIIAVTWQAPWLIPYEPELRWMVPVAGIVLLVPFFFVSWWIEYLISRGRLRELDRKSVKLAVRNANLLTYGLMVLCLLIWLIISVVSK